MNCLGIDALTGVAIEIEFGETIHAVRAASAPAEFYIAPGWIDIQVNGFAGVDYQRSDALRMKRSRDPFTRNSRLG